MYWIYMSDIFHLKEVVSLDRHTTKICHIWMRNLNSLKKKTTAEHIFQNVNIYIKVPLLSNIEISRAIALWWKATK